MVDALDFVGLVDSVLAAQPHCFRADIASDAGQSSSVAVLQYRC